MLKDLFTKESGSFFRLTVHIEYKQSSRLQKLPGQVLHSPAAWRKVYAGQSQRVRSKSNKHLPWLKYLVLMLAAAKCALATTLFFA